VQREANRQLWQAVDDLDDKHRLVVILRYVHDLSTAEIADALDISQGTVHSRLFYARRQLQKWLSFLEEVADGA
jgi:RNA polymerase sigma-70 factor (ECF subfamily)